MTSWALMTASCLAIFCQSSSHGQLTDGQKEDVGFTALQSRLGAAMPTGEGISVSQVEADEDSGTALRYRPDDEASQLSGKNFVNESGVGDGISNHATTVGRYFYGSSSLAPDIGVSPEEISVYSASDFLGSGFLKNGNSGALPDVEANDIQNHSWVGDYRNSTSLTLDQANAANTQAIRRMDYAIQRDDFVATFGLNNGSGTTVPPLMAGTYNGIVVGRSDGQHSRGGTTQDGGFRTKPDIVVPTNATSWAAPTVGSAAALLLETSRTTAGLSDASKSVVVKSLLFTGATRDESEFGGTWSNSTSQPLDAVYGAGELNVLHSHDILVAGKQDASSASVATSTGWDFGSSNSTVPQLYFFDLADPGSSFEIAASLVWNREITVADTPGPGVNFEFTPNLANLNLRLYSASGFVLGSELEASLSSTDNVELIVAQGLAAGRYAWEVSSDTTGVDYGFSWNVEGLTVIPEPSVTGLALAGFLILARRRR